MKIHLAWIRMTAAAAIVAGAGVHPAGAQYAPMRKAPPTPPAPAAPAAPAATPTVPYVAYRQPAATPYQQTPVAQRSQPTPYYQAPVAAYPQTAATYPQPAAAYPQTASQYPAYPQTTAQYPATGGASYYVANNTPEAVLPAPQQTGPGPGNGNGQVMPGPDTMTAMPSEGTVNGYPAAGCGCNGGVSGYTSPGCGCNGYGDISCYMNDCGPENIWFGGVYFLYMDRVDPSPTQLAVNVETGNVPYPYYPPRTITVVNTAQADYDFRPGMEIRFGSTFSVGGSSGCNSGCGGCNTGCGSCCPPTMFAWEVAAWGLDYDDNSYTFIDVVNTRIYGMKSFAGLQHDRDGGGNVYGWRPVNDYYNYEMPIQAPQGGPPVGYINVLANRVWTNWRAQNLEANLIRFPLACGTGCGGCNSGCGYDACGCNSGCGCDDCCGSNFSMYGSCGVRYFRIDDDFAYDVEYGEWDGAAYDHTAFDGWGFGVNELCYDVNVDNNLIGPQFGWTNNYCIGCKWNFFLNTTFGIFNNHISQRQRVWNDGGAVQFANGDSADVRSSKDTVSFLGELRVGGSYDFTCHCRGVLAYRAIGLTGIATSVGQIPDNFSDRADVANINSDNSMIIHGLQTGVEFQY